MMKKALLATAIAGVIAAPIAAQADVTVYGKSRVAVSKTDAGAANDQWIVDDEGTRIGFKGSEDLGGGLKAIFKQEAHYNVDTAGAINNARNSYVGLSGSFGTFLGGRHDTPAKMAFYATGADQSDTRGVADLNTNRVTLAGGGNMSFFDEVRTSNALAYVTPNFNGFTLAIATVAGEAPAAAQPQDGLADAWSLGAMYDGGMFNVALGYESLPSVVAGGNDEKQLYLGGSVNFGAGTVGLVYNDVSNDRDQGGNNADRDTIGLTGTMNFGSNNTVGLTYAKMDADNANITAANRGDYTKWGLQFTHKMSKRTLVYASYGKDDFDGNTTAGAVDADTSDFRVALHHDF